MSLVDHAGEKVELEVDKFAMEVRDALSGLDVKGMRRFGGRLFLAAGHPRAEVARAFRCSVVQLDRDCRLPP